MFAALRNNARASTRASLRSLLCLTVFLFSAAAIVSCGGGGGGSTTAGGGIGGTGISYGTVTGTGSIDLNGSKYTTTSTTPVTIEDRVGTFSTLVGDIRNGMVAKVDATFTSGLTVDGAATAIVIRDNLEGPIDSVSCATGTIGVMGQTVLIDGTTKIEQNGAAFTCTQLSRNDIIEVFGASDNAGNILASLIQRKGTLAAGVSIVEVKGVISGLTTTSFQIGNLSVNFDASTEIDNKLGGLANGKSVEVKGTMTDAGGSLTATKVEPFGATIGGTANQQAEVEGLITNCAIAGCTSFSVNGLAVSVQATTTFRDGVASDLLNGRKVEAEGTISSGGVLVASKISFKSGSVKIERAAADGKGTDDSISVLGILVKRNALTKIDLGAQGQNLASITAGTLLRVQGYDNGNDPASGKRSVIATEIKLDGGGGGGNRPRLQGAMETKNAAAGTFSILGVLITVDSGTTFTDSRDNPVPTSPANNESQFFALPEGTLVKARGSENPDNAIDAQGIDGEIEVED